MKQKLLLQIISTLFAFKAIFGIVYILFGWKITIANWLMPTWLIIVAIIVDSYIAYKACKFSKGKK